MWHISKQSKKLYYQGFSLSEVLMALAIVGIIAAITVPSLVQSTSKDEYYQRFKSAYSLLDTATEAINAECNGNIKNCLTNPNTGDNDEATVSEIYNLYKKHLKIVKDCGTGTGCFGSGFYKHLNGSPHFDYNGFGFRTMILANGFSLAIDWNGLVGYGATVGAFNLYIDLNGITPPNQLGRDLFWLSYNPNSGELEPMGGLNYSLNDCSLSSDGKDCAGRIIKEGGINYY